METPFCENVDSNSKHRTERAGQAVFALLESCSEHMGREVLMGHESLPPGTRERLANGAIAGQNLLPNGEIRQVPWVGLKNHPLTVAGRKRQQNMR